MNRTSDDHGCGFTAVNLTDQAKQPLKVSSIDSAATGSNRNGDVSKRNPILATFLGLAKEQTKRPVVKKTKACKAAVKNLYNPHRDNGAATESFAQPRGLALPTPPATRSKTRKQPLSDGSDLNNTFKVTKALRNQTLGRIEDGQPKPSDQVAVPLPSPCALIEHDDVGTSHLTTGQKLPAFRFDPLDVTYTANACSVFGQTHPYAKNYKKNRATNRDLALQEDLDDDDLLSLFQPVLVSPGRQITLKRSSFDEPAFPTNMSNKGCRSGDSNDDQWISKNMPYTQPSNADVFTLAVNMLVPSQNPIVRSQSRTPALDRSPVVGLTSDEIIRTCFRIGEALNSGCNAARINRSLVVELYARVVCSHREGSRQHFVFADLFHNHPPYLTGSYEHWKGVELWDYDCATFLGSSGRGRLCRCVARMRREGQTWSLFIMSIWEATWDDINHVHGIIAS